MDLSQMILWIVLGKVDGDVSGPGPDVHDILLFHDIDPGDYLVRRLALPDTPI